MASEGRKEIMNQATTEAGTSLAAEATFNAPEPKETPDGYPALAKLMSARPEFVIFRGFRELNHLNLLRLQAELQELEHDLDVIITEDAQSSNLARQNTAKSFYDMKLNGATERQAYSSMQWDRLSTIGEKLKEYNAALESVLQLQKAPQPTEQHLQILLTWLKKPSGGNRFLIGEESEIWNRNNTADFVTSFSNPLEEDPFLEFLSGPVLDKYHALRQKMRDLPQTLNDLPQRIRDLPKKIRDIGKPSTKTETSQHEAGSRQDPVTSSDNAMYEEYSDKKILRLSNIISATLSSVLPTVSILVLFFVKRMIVRIGLVILFTATFSLTLATFTNAKKVEIFSATAAFAAVEVVFIGSSDIQGEDSDKSA